MKFKNLLKQLFSFNTIRSRVTLLVGILLSVILIFSSLVLFQNQLIKNKSERVAEFEYPAAMAASNINSDINRQAFSMRGNVIRKDTAWTGERDIRWEKDIFPDLKSLESLSHYFPDSSKALLDSLDKYINLYYQKEQELNDWLVNNYVSNGIDFTTDDSLFHTTYAHVAENEKSQLVPMISKMSSVQGWIRNYLEPLLEESQQGLQADVNTIYSRLSSTNYLVIILLSVSILIAFMFGFFLRKKIAKSFAQPTQLLNKLAKGEITKEITPTKDEMGLIVNASNQLSQNLNKSSKFAQSIGEGKFDFEFQPSGENDILGNALLQMRNKLKEISDEDKKRNWTTEGLTKFAEITRKNDNLKDLSLNLISELVKYLKINQGGIFIVEGEDSEKHLELLGCYAYDRVKFLQKSIAIGQGLVGQCYLEREITHLLEIPEDYIFIKSGLGDANPTALLVIPLINNDVVEGVIELAAFHRFEDYQIEFVEKVGEVIAATISSMKINERTRKLLEESQQQSEEMRSQEEEMRQNMEELAATQEEMHRNQNEVNKLLEESKQREESYKLQLDEVEKHYQEELNSAREELNNVKKSLESRS